ncbi:MULTISPECIES: 4'-phosphopantetheinyl transferase family protein [Paraburkholderia]|uniref:4'-phosphopantetheinyl transferase family protein n=1 Tax=Paraburkholderia TaxID=1822464 RepID=UPI0022581D9D|nr:MULTISPECIES: 4'-phosphopantetheinyl transferase superfamily protein [Paraburkholderia]MCX4156703.1 4'-phosphopantetheinyl transferase superfamily protein [Paraburkholderia aspalathi]MDN7166108.1 4'-phosphopantetheinyl transferase superfamily protein [Paraburkholderia sp. SECH2]MDQ6394594.1 4'-phosphopantetheinyl transferase superfamily protein [Paraburkholderia aspalathi]
MSSSLLTPPSAQEVHVWQWDLDVCSGDVDQYWEMLSAQERERADKFRFERHRRRFVAGRGELRRLLSRYLGLSPREIALAYGSDGKPFCTSQPPGWRICFNLSHSENAAALAISSGFEVGIDVEQLRPIEESMPLDVFSTRERAEFTALPDTERQNVFFESWARKEACLKALGTGFILPPAHFEFDLSIRGDTTPRFVGGEAEEATHWRICTLSSSPTCAGAVAARRTDWSIVEMN